MRSCIPIHTFKCVNKRNTLGTRFTCEPSICLCLVNLINTSVAQYSEKRAVSCSVVKSDMNVAIFYARLVL